MASTTGRRLLACSSAGGHFKQLVRLVRRIPEVGEVTWLTYDSGFTEGLLEWAGRGGDRVVYAPYAAPRDLANLARDAVVARRLLSEDSYDLAVSTGAGLAVATLPLARAFGVSAHFIETVARTQGPSLSGRLMQRIPGVDLITQNRGYPRGWRYVGSVHDEFKRGPDKGEPTDIRKVVVTLGTSKKYGFRRLVERLKHVIPDGTLVLWQTGATDVSGLGIEGHTHLPSTELEEAIREADVLVAHAGAGSALTGFELGRWPILVPRRPDFGENIDDHQAITARTLAKRDLAMNVDADEITFEHQKVAASRSVIETAELPALDF